MTSDRRNKPLIYQNPSPINGVGEMFNDLPSKTIRLLRFPLAVAVVFAHEISRRETGGQILQIDWLNFSGMELYNCIRILISNVIVLGARPCFFIISGFLFFKNITIWKNRFYIDKIKRRFTTLIIPYLLWILIPVTLKAIYFFFLFDGSFELFKSELLENGILKIFWDYHDFGTSCNNIFGTPVYSYFPYNPPLWFLRDLIMLTFLAPLVYFFIKYSKIAGIIVLGICYYTQVWIYISGFSIDAFFFFSLGAYFSINNKNMMLELQKSKLLWLFIAIITMFLSLYFAGSNNYDFFRRIYIIAGSITAINIATVIVKRDNKIWDTPLITFLSKTSFFIFAAHTVGLMRLSNHITNIILKWDNLFFLIIRYFTAPLICVSLCIALYYIASKTFPKLLKILTGSR